MINLYNKLRNFCEEIKPDFLDKKETNLKNISDFYPEGFKINIIVNIVFFIFIITFYLFRLIA